jgi:hypothetical protein
MEEQMVGQGSQYPWPALDAHGKPFDDAKTYKLHLPPHIPVKYFWWIIVYDTQTRSMLQTDQQAPSVSSQNKDLQSNADGSVDVWFGPKAPPGQILPLASQPARGIVMAPWRPWSASPI